MSIYVGLYDTICYLIADIIVAPHCVSLSVCFHRPHHRLVGADRRIRPMHKQFVLFVKFVVGRNKLSDESESSVFVGFMNTDCTD